MPKAELVGVRGSTCQTEKPDSARQAANLCAAGPKSPVPKLPGSEETCSKTPAARRKGNTYSSVRTRQASGGSVSDTDQGRPWKETFSAVISPRLPQLEPP